MVWSLLKWHFLWFKDMKFLRRCLEWELRIFLDRILFIMGAQGLVLLVHELCAGKVWCVMQSNILSSNNPKKWLVWPPTGNKIFQGKKRFTSMVGGERVWFSEGFAELARFKREITTTAVL